MHFLILLICSMTAKLVWEISCQWLMKQNTNSHVLLLLKCHYDQILNVLFLHFPKDLPKFQSTTIIKTHIFWTLTYIQCNLWPPSSKYWLRIWVHDVIFSKIPHKLKLQSQLVWKIAQIIYKSLSFFVILYENCSTNCYCSVEDELTYCKLHLLQVAK